jgi:AmmeMemoRadiSam system protein A
MRLTHIGFLAAAIACWPEIHAAESDGGGKSEAGRKGGAVTNQIQGGRVMKEHCSGEWSPGLTEDEKTTLFAIAKDTLSWCVSGSKGEFPFDRYTLTPKLKERTATFVTLKKRGMLRGCIGTLGPVDPLYRSIHRNAVSAAIEDYRFQPVTPAELPQLEVDLSVLSPIRAIMSLEEFKIGEHGIIIEKGSSRAVYLPEVAVEQKWSRDETLSSLSQKAGLPPDAWKQGARFKVFSSVVLSED